MVCLSIPSHHTALSEFDRLHDEAIWHTKLSLKQRLHYAGISNYERWRANLLAVEGYIGAQNSSTLVMQAVLCSQPAGNSPNATVIWNSSQVTHGLE